MTGGSAPRRPSRRSIFDRATVKAERRFTPRPTVQSRPSTLTVTAFMLVAFAANSVLGGAALGGAAIDPFTFNAVRMASAAGALVALSSIGRIQRCAG